MYTEHPTEEKLTALLFDEGDEETKRHLRHCAFCQARMAELADFHFALAETFYRLTCPEPDVLTRYLEHRLARDEEAAVRGHISHCQHCQEALAAISPYVGSLSNTETPGWWAAMADGARRFFRAQLAPSPRLQPARGDESRFYHYHTPEFDILFSIMPVASDAFTLVGQMTPLSDSDAPLQGRVRTAIPETEQAPVVIDETGVFQIDDLPAGRYLFQIEIDPDVAIELEVDL